MTADRDPALQELFDVAKQDLAGEAFVTQVMSQIDSLRTRVMVGWICVGLVLAPIAWLLSGPLLVATDLAMQILPESLIELDNRWLAKLLSPVNSVAGIVGLGILGLRLAYRKIFA